MARPQPEQKPFFDQMFPVPQFRRDCLGAFVDALGFAISLGSDKWSTLILGGKGEKVRLYVGHVVAATLSPKGLWLAVDREKVESSSAAETFFEKCQAWRWDLGSKGKNGSYPEYSSIKSRNGYYSPGASHREDWMYIRDYHFESLRKAAKRPLRKKWPATPTDDYLRGQIEANPFRQSILPTLEDGDAAETATAAKRHMAPVLSLDELGRRIHLAEQFGRAGERLVCEHLRIQKEAGVIHDFEWTSDVNAIAPYDFLITLPEGEKIAVDVKSTNGRLEQKFYVSFAELREMTRSRRYDIYRVFEASETSGKLRIAKNVSSFAAATLKIISQLPEGVKAEAISVNVSVLNFADEAMLAFNPLEEG